ncbi:protein DETOXIFICATION 15-like [Vitis vinifera]|uniref:protein DETOXIFICATION 15-like n=1 Tax=Vitis vinifera TaxID=29760 RepID=UPI002882F3B5|nr:protein DETOXIFICATION 15-like [Vitis vinifera]
MGSALDTFCGQSFGAKQYHMLGIHKQRAMVVLLLVSIPVAFIWSNTGYILASLGQDPEISAEAGLYAHFMIPSIFGFTLLQCHIRFLQAQNNVVPMMIKSGLRNKGAALANAIFYWINVLLLAIYVRISPSCKKTWIGFSREAMHDVPKFLRLAIPSAVMIWYLQVHFNNKIVVVLFMVTIEDVLVATILILGHKFWGYSYSNEEKVVKYVGEIMVLLAISHFWDGIQSVLSGQHLATRDWQMVLVLMAGAKRHLELKKCLQLGGYASSSSNWVVMQAVVAVVVIVAVA